MKFGASIWPWKWDAPYAEAVRRIARSGFRATELIAWNESSLSDYYTPATIAVLRRTLADEGMTLSQFVVSNHAAASADPSRRRQSVDIFMRGADVAAELGATIVNTVTHMPLGLPYPRITDRPSMQTFSIEVPNGSDWQRNWDDYVATLKECAAYAESLGLRYSLEPHPFRYGANADGMLRLLEAVDSPALGVNLDPSHLFPVGEIPNIVIYRLGSRIVHCHFSDNDGETNVHWRTGMGKIDWTHVLRALKDVGYDGVVSLEFEDVPGVSRAQAQVSGAYKGNAVASDGFENEYKVALDFLSDIAREVGVTVS
jgi:sugar phosphate isomerase/epimerase